MLSSQPWLPLRILLVGRVVWDMSVIQIPSMVAVLAQLVSALNLYTYTSSSAPRANPPKRKITNQNEHLDAGMGIWITVTSQTTLPTGIIRVGSHGCEDSPKFVFVQREVQTRYSRSSGCDQNIILIP